MTRVLKHTLLFCLLATPVAMPAALAQNAETIEEVVVVGSRRQDRSASESPVPVDVVDGEDFANQGLTDMDAMLAALIPSYNVSQQPISDAATLIRPANLRGLSPDHTLVLVNGKRRHKASVISFLGGGISDGAQGPDLSVIPSIAIKRVEVLRDGASAQYGSDAIAGVMNFILKDAPTGGSLDLRWGETYDGDGDRLTLQGNVGFPLTDAGFANFSFQWTESDPTSRSVQRSDAQTLIDAGNDDVRTPVTQVWGAPEIKDDWTIFGNLGLDLGNGMEAYSFGNISERKVEGGFFYRNPNTRDGIFNGMVDDMGTLDPSDDLDTILVANFNPLGDPTGSACGVGGVNPAGAGAVHIINDVPDANQSANLGEDCYMFNSKFPGGFTPFFGGTISDASIAAGVRGEMDNGWYWDLSAVVGRSRSTFKISNTINPQLATSGDDIQTSYTAGTYMELDSTFNFDMSKGFEVGAFYSPLNVAWGLEYRDEMFKIEAGDPGSYFIDPNDNISCLPENDGLCTPGGDGIGDLAQQGFGIGSNGFAGFKPGIAGENDRTSWATYVDLEADVIESLTLGVAARFEDFDDFGDTFNGKLAARWQIMDVFAIRGSVSTGFRAPTVGQSNVENVTTAFTDGVLADEATLAPSNPISIQKGSAPLEPEESTNYSVGAVFNFDMVNITLDYYNIELKDRIATTDTQILCRLNVDGQAGCADGVDDDITPLLAAGVQEATTLTGVKFFTNDFQTTTQGVDLVATTATDWLGGQTNWNLLFNWTDTNVDKWNPSIITPKRIIQLEETIPTYRSSLTANHMMGNWRFLGRVSFYDGYTEFFGNETDWRIDAGSRWLLDAEVAYTFNDAVTILVGAHNLTDTTPTKQDDPGDRLGSIYGEQSPFGYGGGFYYLRAIWDFR